MKISACDYEHRHTNSVQKRKNLNKGLITEKVMEKKKKLTYFSSKTSFSHTGAQKYCVFSPMHKETSLLIEPDYSPWPSNLNFWRRELNIASSVAKCLKQKIHSLSTK